MTRKCPHHAFKFTAGEIFPRQKWELGAWLPLAFNRSWVCNCPFVPLKISLQLSILVWRNNPHREFRVIYVHISDMYVCAYKLSLYQWSPNGMNPYSNVYRVVCVLFSLEGILYTLPLHTLGFRQVSPIPLHEVQPCMLEFHLHWSSHWREMKIRLLRQLSNVCPAFLE